MGFGRPYKDYSTSDLENMQIRFRGSSDPKEKAWLKDVNKELKIRYENKARNGTFT